MNPILDRLEEVEARAEAATPGPWRKDVNSSPPMPHYYIRHQGQGWPIASMSNYSPKLSNGNWKADIDFIAHSRTDIPYLTSTVRALVAENERLQGVVDRAVAQVREYSLCCECAHFAVGKHDAPCCDCDADDDGSGSLWQWRGEDG